MKHHIIDKYNGTKILYPLHKKIYTIRGEKDELYQDDTFINSNVEMYHLGSYKDNIYYVKEGKTYFNNITIEKNIIPNSISEKHALFTSDFDLENRTLKYEVVDIENNQIIHDFGSLPYKSKTYGKDSYFLHFSKERLAVFNLTTKTFETKPTNEIFQDENTTVAKVISIFEGLLYIATNNNELVCIRLNDLFIIKKWNKVPDLFIGSMYKEVIPDATIFNLDIQERRLIGLFDRCVIELNIDTQEITFSDLTENLFKKNINSFRPTDPLTITDNYILTVGHFDVPDKPNIDFKGLIALDKISFNIVDTYIFMDRDIGTRNLIVRGEKIYLVDWEKNVHELEVE